MIRRAVVVGGAGAVGGLFAAHLRDSGVDVCVVDAPCREGDAGPGLRFRPGDIARLSPEVAAELAGADLALLAVPEPVALAAAGDVLAALPPGALLADTLSVKQGIAATLAGTGGDDAVGDGGDGTDAPAPTGHVELVSLNPMFAPSLGFSGRPVAAVVLRDGPRAQSLLDLVGTWGARVVRVNAEAHDRLVAAGQALTHAAVLAFGLALVRLDASVAELRELAPPPHATLLALLARIAAGNPEVYWDVQAGNQAAPLARQALLDGVERLTDALAGGPERFALLLDELRDHLGDDVTHFRDTCARLFTSL